MTSICQLAAETVNHTTTPFSDHEWTWAVWISVLARPTFREIATCYTRFEVLEAIYSSMISLWRLWNHVAVTGVSGFLVGLKTVILTFPLPNEGFLPLYAK
jgi:hypothetical protein